MPNRSSSSPNSDKHRFIMILHCLVNKGVIDKDVARHIILDDYKMMEELQEDTRYLWDRSYGDSGS